MDPKSFPWEVKDNQRQRSDYEDYREACESALNDEQSKVRSDLATYEWLY